MGKLFNRNSPIDISVVDPESPTGRKSCTVRFPADQEWCGRASQTVIVNRSLGRDQTKADIPKMLELNHELFKLIRTDADGPAFDEAEANSVVTRLERCQAGEVERAGNQYRISLTVLGGVEVVHTLKMPTEKQKLEFQKAAVRITGVRGGTQTRISLEPSADLWSKLVADVTGYEGGKDGVPVTHKDVAVTELLAQINAEMDAGDPEI